MNLKLQTLALSAIALSALGSAQVQISEGHVDLGLAYDAGTWDPHIHVHDTDAEYATDEAYFYYGAASQAARPAGTAYDFIGVAAGATIYRNYMSNQPNIPWLGFGLEEISNGTFGSFTQTDSRRDPILGEWVDFDVVGYTAPAGGHMSFFQGSGSSPTMWFSTFDGLSASDKFISTVGGHEHGAFAFTQPGIYTLTLRASALDITSGQRISSDPYTYTFGVMAQPVPEPATMAALGLGALGLLRRRRRA